MTERKATKIIEITECQVFVFVLYHTITDTRNSPLSLVFLTWAPLLSGSSFTHLIFARAGVWCFFFGVWASTEAPSHTRLGFCFCFGRFPSLSRRCSLLFPFSMSLFFFVFVSQQGTWPRHLGFGSAFILRLLLLRHDQVLQPHPPRASAPAIRPLPLRGPYYSHI